MADSLGKIIEFVEAAMGEPLQDWQRILLLQMLDKPVDLEEFARWMSLANRRGKSIAIVVCDLAGADDVTDHMILYGRGGEMRGIMDEFHIADRFNKFDEPVRMLAPMSVDFDEKPAHRARRVFDPQENLTKGGAMRRNAQKTRRR